MPVAPSCCSSSPTASACASWPRSRPIRNANGTAANTSCHATGRMPGTWSPVTVCEVSVTATSAINTIPDHSSGASTRRWGRLAERQRAARTQITAPASVTAATLVKTSPTLPSVVELVTWMTLSGQRSHAWSPDSRIGSAPTVHSAYTAMASRRSIRRRSVPSGIGEQQVHEHAEVEVRRQDREREDRRRVRGRERVHQPQEAGQRHQRAGLVGRAAVPGEEAGARSTRTRRRPGTTAANAVSSTWSERAITAAASSPTRRAASAGIAGAWVSDFKRATPGRARPTTRPWARTRARRSATRGARSPRSPGSTRGSPRESPGGP